MFRKLVAVAATTLLLGTVAGPLRSDAGPADSIVDTNAAPGGFMSDNVEWLGNIPLDTTGIAGRIVDVAGQRRLYVHALAGLSIYDIDNPTVPVLMGHLPLPNFQNEDVAVSKDGSRVLVTTDRLLGSSGGVTYVLDTSIPQAPLVEHVIPRTSHTVSCVTDDCAWVYNADGEIYWLDAPGGPEVRTGSNGWAAQVNAPSFAHDLNVDAAGYVISDSRPRVMMDVSDPAHPVRVASSNGNEGVQGPVVHNNQRVDADQWVSRGSDPATGDLRPGELLLSNGELNFTWLKTPISITNPQPPLREEPCDDDLRNGSFSTWDMRNWDKGRAFTPIEVFEPVNSNLDDLPDGENRPWMDGNPQYNVSGCSGHWFDHLPADADGNVLVSAGWYEHGTRILSVDSATGDIDEVGFFQSVNGSTWAAYWVTDEIIYTVDLMRGIDILRFHRDGPLPTIDDLVESWTAPVDPQAAALAANDRFYCDLAGKEGLTIG